MVRGYSGGVSVVFRIFEFDSVEPRDRYFPEPHCIPDEIAALIAPLRPRPARNGLCGHRGELREMERL
jgi:hypothetical protein